MLCFGSVLKKRLENFLKTLVIAWTLHVTAAESRAKQRPNIILIVADDLGWNDVSFHGSQQIPTPKIDKLARQGIILNNYYVAPICTPSRSSLLTGKYPIHLGTQHNVIYGLEPWGLGLNEILLPQYLKSAGYKSHIVGKWGDWGLDLHNGTSDVKDVTGRYATDLFTKRTEQIIQNHNKSTPLFLYLAHLAVHSANQYDPLQTTKRYYDRFPNIDHNGRRLFAGMVAGLDESVGRIHRALKSSGMDKNSIIVFTTDNGGPAASFDDNYANNWPLRGVKDTLWEGGVRGSAFLWSPLLKNVSRVSNQMMHISDWVPTLLSASGLKNTEINGTGRISSLGSQDVLLIFSIDGIDMWSALSTGSPSPRTEVLHNIDHDRNVYSLRVKNFKIIIGTTYEGQWDGWYSPEGKNLSYSTSVKAPARLICNPPSDPKILRSCQPLKGPCLFDIEKDPCEYQNLAETQPHVLRKMMDRLKSYNVTVVPPRNQPPDPAGKPQRHRYVWSPWIGY